MDTIYTAIQLMKQGCYMASIALQYAYYTVPVFQDQGFFGWDSCIQYTCLPNGLASASLIFTKIMKPGYAFLRCKGIFLLVTLMIRICRITILMVVELMLMTPLLCLSHWALFPIKSVKTPVQKLVLLGFTLNSIDMTVSLTLETATKLKNACIRLSMQSNPSIQEVAHVIGLMVASFPAVTFALFFCGGLQWWISNVEISSKF